MRESLCTYALLESRAKSSILLHPLTNNRLKHNRWQLSSIRTCLPRRTLRQAFHSVRRGIYPCYHSAELHRTLTRVPSAHYFSGRLRNIYFQMKTRAGPLHFRENWCGRTDLDGGDKASVVSPGRNLHHKLSTCSNTYMEPPKGNTNLSVQS